MPYLDTSIVLAYYVPEPLSARAQAVFTAQAEAPTISELVELEVFSALSLRMRMGDLEPAHVDRVAGLFLSHLEGGWYSRVHLHAGHYVAARGFIARFDLPLRAPDALHLAVAASEGLALVTADRQLARNAESLGLAAELLA